MRTHNPQKVIENLRDHLAAHNKPILFMFGAGTSSAVNIAPVDESGKQTGYIPLIPSIIPLTQRCKNAVGNMGDEYKHAWEKLETQCHNSNSSANIESILSKVHSKIEAIGDEETLLGLSKEKLLRLEERIRKTIGGAVYPKQVPSKLPHDDFAQWIKKVRRNKTIEIFTTNYDILFERAMELAQVPFFDGFVGSHQAFFFSDSIERESLLPPSSWVRLWKIHGSINWLYQENRCGIEQIMRGKPSGSGEMILPSHQKYNQSKKQPYLALLDRLSLALKTPHCLMITSGYSFGDEHINEIIFSALDRYPSTHLISLQYEEISEEHFLTKKALQCSNFLVLGPNAAVISGRFGHWKLINSIDHTNRHFMRSSFQEHHRTESPEEALLTGRFMLGDFKRFCEFLTTMKIDGE